MMIINNIPSVLIVDDDQAICDFVGEILIVDGYAYEIASNAHDALVKMRLKSYDIALLDIKLPDSSGIDLLKTLRLFTQTTSIIMMTAIKDLDTAIQAMKLGALDYVVKPFTIEKLTASIATVLQNREIHDSSSAQSEKLKNSNSGREIIGQSLGTIDAIAMGVDAQVDYFDFHSTLVTEKTVELAQRLGLPAKEIDKWENIRHKQYNERRNYISNAINKLDRMPFAQALLGLTKSIIRFPQARGEQN
jgi:FixJ family two-component response regulator